MGSQSFIRDLYQCEFCCQLFNNKEDLITHLNDCHSSSILPNTFKVTKNQCRYCKKEFMGESWSTDLEFHEKHCLAINGHQKWSEIMQLKCPLCNFSCSGQ